MQQTKLILCIAVQGQQRFLRNTQRTRQRSENSLLKCKTTRIEILHEPAEPRTDGLGHPDVGYEGVCRRAHVEGFFDVADVLPLRETLFETADC